MRSERAWLLLVSLMPVCGVILGGEDPKPEVENLKAALRAAATAQRDCSQRLGLPVEITNSIGMKLRLIPAGVFVMGSPESDRRADHDEHPQHKVRITKPFYLGVYEVKQAEYEKLMRENPSSFSKGGHGADRVSGRDTSGHPVDNVSWDDAVKFCKKLSTKEGNTYRLPTEAEWEYACRARTTMRYYFGDDAASLGAYAWYKDNSDETHPAGEKKPNAWGLHDMCGNVWEWCQDWYGRSYYAVSPTDDPPGPDSASNRVFRGGSWNLEPWFCRAAIRGRGDPLDGFDYLGFRVAAVPPRGQLKKK